MPSGARKPSSAIRERSPLSVFVPLPHILLIPGTSSVEHLRDNVASVALTLPDHALSKLDAIAA